jgi:hypothetical protein
LTSVATRARRRVDFNSGHLRTTPRQRQRKVTEPTKQCEDLVLGLQLQQVECLGHHLTIDIAVDLHKIQRIEADTNITIQIGLQEKFGL